MVRLIKGQVIVELLVAMGLASIFLPALITGFVSGSNGKVQQQQRVKAMGYLTEAAEAVRSVREADWSYITTNGTYHPMITSDCVNTGGSTWKLCSGTETIGDFTRSITIADMSPSDPSLKQITVTVSWSNILPTNLTSTFYLTRWKNITSDLTVSGTLVNQGNGDWCAPTLTLATLDLPKNGVANAVSAIQGQLAAGTGDNASGVSYANVAITDPAAPTAPIPSIAGTYDGFKTNGVFTEQNYAYLATDTNNKEVDIINLNSITGGKYAEAGYFNAPGNGNATAVATSGNVGYMVGGTKLYNFDLSSKSGSRSALDSDGVTLPGTATSLAIYGTRAYITTSSTTNQLVIVDIHTNTNLTILRSVALDALGGKMVYINSTGTRAFVATGSSSTKRELFIVNIDETTSNWTTLTGSQLTKGSYDTNGMDPKGVVQVNISDYLIVVGTGGSYQYQVVDISNESSPALCTHGGTTTGQLAIATGVNGVSTVFTSAQRAYAYIITGDASSELKIIEGGPGGGGSGGGLTVESASLDAGHSSIFNRFDQTSITPSSGVTVSYQVAISTDCSTFNYTSASPGQISLSLNPGRCFRYKATFSGTPGTVSTTVKVNYSP